MGTAAPWPEPRTPWPVARGLSLVSAVCRLRLALPVGMDGPAGPCDVWRTRRWNECLPRVVELCMKAFGFLSFGHYGHGTGPGDPDAGQALKDAVEIAVGADEIGVNGAYWRVHHFARQAASPFPLLAAAGARTSRIEVGTGVIDMR